MDKYFGEYVRFETGSKKDAAQLIGPDNLIGDIYGIECEIIDGVHRAWLISRFDKKIGFFDPESSKDIGIKEAQGMVCKAILVFVAFSEDEEGGYYWGEVGLICYSPAYADEMTMFIDGIRRKIAEGIKPKISLDRSSVSKIIESGGSWMPNQSVSYPDMQKGTTYIKRRRSMTDKLIEQGRAGNKGCYFISWAFLLVIVALVVYFIFQIFD